MKHLGCITGLVGWSLLLYATLSHAEAPTPIGHVAALEGDVLRRHMDIPAAERLSVQSPVYQGDEIQTLTDAKVKLVLVDGTVLTLGPKSALRLTEYVYTPPSSSQKSVLQLFFGVFRAVVQHVLPGGSVEVHTSNAVAAIRGTDWMARVEFDATAVVVLEGTVSVRQARSDIGGAVVLTAGVGTDVRADQPPTPPKQWGAPRIEALRQATTLP
jgi:hypothetical protein